MAMVGVFNPVTWYFFERDFLSRHKVDHIVLAVYWNLFSGWDRELDSYREQASRTALLGGWNFDVPSWLPAPLRHSQIVARSLRRFAAIRAYAARGGGAAAGAISAPSRPSSPTGADFVRMAAARAAAAGAEFSVLVLPLLAADADVRTGLDDIRFLDLNSAGLLQDARQLFPDGHFKPGLASLLGQRLGREICEVNFPEEAHSTVAATPSRGPTN